jgi:hypothetical protein
MHRVRASLHTHLVRVCPRILPSHAGYESKYIALRDALTSEFGSQLLIGGGAGRSSSFEITVGAEAKDRRILYSKLETGAFPDADGVIVAMREFMLSGNVMSIEAAKGGCVLQ